MNKSFVSTLETLPPFLRSKDDLYTNLNSVYLARVSHSGSNQKVLYPKTQVVEFIDHLIKKGDAPNLDNTINSAS